MIRTFLTAGLAVALFAPTAMSQGPTTEEYTAPAVMVKSTQDIGLPKSNSSIDKADEPFDTTLLSETDGTFLNNLFDSVRVDFDFIGKRVMFMQPGHSVRFEHYKEGVFKYSENVGELNPQAVGKLYILSPDEKSYTGGYDAVVYSWMKILIPREKILWRVRKYSINEPARQ